MKNVSQKPDRWFRKVLAAAETKRQYCAALRQRCAYFKWAQGKPPDAITAHDVDEFIGWQQSLGRAQATIRRRLIALRIFFDYLAFICEEHIDNPVITQRHYIDQGHRLPRDIRQEEIEKLFTLMLHSGIRVGEVVNLCLEDVYLSEKRSAHLRVNGKGQRERIAYLSATATQLMSKYLSGRPAKKEEKVFLNQRGKSITITGIQLQLAKYCYQAGIWVTCHQLSHTFACRMIAAGVPVTSVQKMLGHTSIRTTQLYVQVADRQVEKDYHTGIQKVIEKSTTHPEVSNG